MQSSMYTLETLVPDCVGRYITNDKGNVHLGSLINARTYSECWQAFTHWAVMQFDEGHSISLAPLGVVMRGVSGDSKAAESKSNTARNKSKSATTVASEPQFFFLKSYVDKHNLQLKHPEKQSDGMAHALPVNYFMLSKMVSIEATTLRTALSHMFERLGNVLADKKEQVLIDVGIGTLAADHGVSDFIFHETLDKHGNIISRTQNVSTEDSSELDPSVPPMRQSAKWTGMRGRERGKGMASTILSQLSTSLSSPQEVKELRNRYPLPRSPVAEHNNKTDGSQRQPTPPHDQTATIGPATAVSGKSFRHSGRKLIEGTAAPLASTMPLPQIQSKSKSDAPSFAVTVTGAMAHPNQLQPLSHKRLESFQVLQHGDLLLDHPQKELGHMMRAPTPLGAIRANLAQSSPRAYAVHSDHATPYSPKQALAKQHQSHDAHRRKSETFSFDVSSDGPKSPPPLPSVSTSGPANASGPRRGSTLLSNHLPPALDAFARTQAATYDDDGVYQSVCAKVGNFYTPQAASVTINLKTGKVVCSGPMPFEALEPEPASSSSSGRPPSPGEDHMQKLAVEKSKTRYQYYIESGIADDIIAPIKPEWIQ